VTRTTEIKQIDLQLYRLSQSAGHDAHTALHHTAHTMDGIANTRDDSSEIAQRAIIIVSYVSNYAAELTVIHFVFIETVNLWNQY